MPDTVLSTLCVLSYVFLLFSSSDCSHIIGEEAEVQREKWHAQNCSASIGKARILV